MTTTEIILLAIFLLLGAFEFLSNAYHLTRGSVAEISKSAKKQHQEMPMDLKDRHYLIKAILMLLFGIAFLGIGISILLTGRFQYWPAVLVMTGFSLYSFVQALLYRRFWRVWMAILVYSLPLIIFILFWRA